ncbi:MAG: ethanolamine utilization protein EutH [Candidatus Leucobacter sulfamidivorax]|nr:ethanolamine utilization protein EutH [Candidatus Leucobacter sulfamidivorax]
MELLGQIIIWIMMAFLLVGAFAYMFIPKSGYAVEFKEGILTMGHIFIPVAGMMGIIPLLVPLIEGTVGPLYLWMHSDPSIAISTLLPSDQGAYALSLDIAGSHGAWIQAFTVSLTSGAVIAFSIPVGLAMLRKADHKYMALGTMSGLLSIPFASFFMSLILMQTGVPLREGLDTTSPGTRPFDLSFGEVLLNLVPLVILMAVLAVLLRFFQGFTVKAFLVFGKVILYVTTVSMALNVVEYFTGVFSMLFGSWPLQPFIADEENQFRALEVVGYIAVMLAGAFPMIYGLRKLVGWILRKAGRGGESHSESVVAGYLAGATNVLALFRIVALMPAKHKVMTIAFSASAGFALGDYLAFTAAFQPNMIVAMILGKIGGGIVGALIALWLAVPFAKRLEQQDIAAGVDVASELEGENPLEAEQEVRPSI